MKENKSALKSAFNRLVAATIALYLVLAGLATFAYVSNQHRIQDGKDAHTAICVLKLDLERRVKEGEQFIKERPNGIPGVPITAFKRSIAGQKATIKALAKASCP